MDRELAIAQLKALVTVPGALKIITAMIAPEYRVDKKDAASPAVPGTNLNDPSSFVLHDVARIEGPNHRGQYTAYSEEYETERGTVGADECTGQPEALLKRLQDWQRQP